MIVRMHMSGAVRTIGPDESPEESAKMMREHRVRRLVVEQGEEVCGIVCSRDLARAAERLGTEKRVTRIREIMNSPVISVSPDDPVEKAARLMTRHHIGSLVVLSGGRLAGIITESDIFRALAQLLTGSGNSTRIMFDISKGEDALLYLVGKTKAHGLTLRSFLTFQDGERLMAVARIRGVGLKGFMDELWESGLVVVNVVHLD